VRGLDAVLVNSIGTVTGQRRHGPGPFDPEDPPPAASIDAAVAAHGDVADFAQLIRSGEHFDPAIPPAPKDAMITAVGHVEVAASVHCDAGGP